MNVPKGSVEHEFMLTNPMINGYIDLYNEETRNAFEFKITTNPDYYNAFTMEDQLGTYFAAMPDIERFMVRTFTRPRLRQGKDESNTQLYERMKDDIRKRPNHYYKENTYYRNEFDTKEVLRKYRWIAEEIKELVSLGEEVKDVMSSIDGTINIEDNVSDSSGDFVFSVDKQMASFYGLTSLDIASAIRNAVFGLEASSINLDSEDIEINIKYDEGEFKNVEDLKNIIIFNQRGDSVRLSQVADVSLEPSVLSINHLDGDKVVIINASITEGTNLQKGAKVKLKVSVGPNIGMVRVPELLGLSFKEAEELLNKNSLNVGKINYQSSKNLLPNTVVAQYPAKNKLLNVGESVDLFITKSQD